MYTKHDKEVRASVVIVGTDTVLLTTWNFWIDPEVNLILAYVTWNTSPAPLTHYVYTYTEAHLYLPVEQKQYLWNK